MGSLAGVWKYDLSVVKTTTPPTSIPNPPSQPVTEASEKPKVTSTRKAARPQKSEPETAAVPKLAAGKFKKKSAASVKTAAAIPTTPSLVVPNQFHLPTQGNF